MAINQPPLSVLVPAILDLEGDPFTLTLSLPSASFATLTSPSTLTLSPNTLSDCGLHLLTLTLRDARNATRNYTVRVEVHTPPVLTRAMKRWHRIQIMGVLVVEVPVWRFENVQLRDCKHPSGFVVFDQLIYTFMPNETQHIGIFKINCTLYNNWGELYYSITVEVFNEPPVFK
jgi:hypothetical protein